MQPIIYKINLDLHESNSQYLLKLTRGDVGGEIRATFNEAGKTYSLENCTCKFSALKGDGNYIYNDCTVNTESNYVSYIITDQTSAACGVSKCQLIVIGNDGKIKAAPKFEIVIDDKVYDEQEIIDSTSEFNTITSLQASVSTNTSDISSLQNDVSNNSSNISILQTEIQGTGTSIALSINSSTYVMTLQLKNSNGDTISTGTIDLPLETMVVGASYNNTNKTIILTLQNGNTVSFSVADLVSGLVSESELNSAISEINTDLLEKENLANKVTSLSSSSTDAQYPSAKAVYEALEGKVSTDVEIPTVYKGNGPPDSIAGGVKIGDIYINRSIYPNGIYRCTYSREGIGKIWTSIAKSNEVNTLTSNVTNLQSSVSALEENKADWDEVYTYYESDDIFVKKVDVNSSVDANSNKPVSSQAVYNYIQSLNGNGVNY